MCLQRNPPVQTSAGLALSFSFFLLFHTHLQSHTEYLINLGNGAVEMFSRQTMQIRPYPQGDPVNGFNHQRSLQRGVCVRGRVRALMQRYQTQTCLQLSANKLDNYGIEKENEVNKALEKIETMSDLARYPSRDQTSPCQFWEKIFSHTDPNFGTENKDGCQTGIVMKILQSGVTSSTSTSIQ